MESLINIARGYARFEVTGARPEGLLNLMSAQGIDFWKMGPITDYKLTFTVRRADAKRIPPLAARVMCTLDASSRHGAPELAYKLRKRYTLMFGFFAVLFLLVWSSFHIWDIEVTGNETVSSVRILNALEECGIGIGSYWPDFVPDIIRSEVLVRVPELAYLTVNVRGSRAEVIVRERIPTPELVQEKIPTDVVAAKAGIITNMSVYRGAPATEVGKAVMPGEKLVSGEVVSPYAGSDFVHAMADVRALTYYELTAVRPLVTERKSYTGADDTRHMLKIGQQRINFYSHGGNEDALYDKIIEERPLSIAGLFTLPLTLVTERRSEYEIVLQELVARTARGEMEEELLSTLARELGEDGELISWGFTALERDGKLTVTLHAQCEENIAVIREIK